jgi:hypothetical protein
VFAQERKSAIVATVPANPKIYHITHVKNLAGIAGAGLLWSDAQRLARKLDCEIVGMSRIKHRRLYEIEVDCHPGTKVGDYVPFYFCPRSIMLYILSRGNHPDVTYSGGQAAIVHLQADLHAVVQWAATSNRRWAFSTGNAGAFLTTFYADLEKLDQVNWPAVAENRWSSPTVKEGKQAEFLLHEYFPWHLIEKIGVHDPKMQHQVLQALHAHQHRPSVDVELQWYY